VKMMMMIITIMIMTVEDTNSHKQTIQIVSTSSYHLTEVSDHTNRMPMAVLVFMFILPPLNFIEILDLFR